MHGNHLHVHRSLDGTSGLSAELALGKQYMSK